MGQFEYNNQAAAALNTFLGKLNAIKDNAATLMANIGAGTITQKNVNYLNSVTAQTTAQMEAVVKNYRATQQQNMNNAALQTMDSLIAINKASVAVLTNFKVGRDTPETLKTATQNLAAVVPATISAAADKLTQKPLAVEYNGKLYAKNNLKIKMQPESLDGMVQGAADISLNCGFYLKNMTADETINWQLTDASGAIVPLEPPLLISARANDAYMGIKWPSDQKTLNLEATAGSRKLKIILEKPDWFVKDLKATDGGRIAKEGQTLYLLKAPIKSESATLSWNSNIDPMLLKDHYTVNGNAPSSIITSSKIIYSFSDSPSTSIYRMNAVGYDKSVKVQLVDKYDNQIDYTQKLQGIGEVFGMVNNISKKVGGVLPCEVYLPKINQMIAAKTFNVGYNILNEEDKNSRHISDKKVVSFKLLSPKIAGLLCEKNLGIKFWIIDLSVGSVYFDLNMGSNINFSHETITNYETKVVTTKKYLQGGLEVGLDVGAKLGNKWEVNGMEVGLVAKAAVNASAGGKVEYPFDGNKEEFGIYGYVNPVKLKITGEATAGIYSKELSWDFVLLDNQMKSKIFVPNIKSFTYRWED